MDHHVPPLLVEIDDEVLARIDCRAYDSACLRIAGSHADLAFCTVELDVSTSRRDGSEENAAFIEEAGLAPGQTLTLRYVDGSSMADERGIWSVQQSAVDQTHADPTMEDWFAVRRSGIRLREGYAFNACTTSRGGRSSSTAPGEHGFDFYAIWDRHRPVRLSLATWRVGDADCTLRKREHWQEVIRLGETATLRIDVL